MMAMKNTRVFMALTVGMERAMKLQKKKDRKTSKKKRRRKKT